jgi:hypothetical protein
VGFCFPSVLQRLSPILEVGSASVRQIPALRPIGPDIGADVPACFTDYAQPKRPRHEIGTYGVIDARWHVAFGVMTGTAHAEHISSQFNQ